MTITLMKQTFRGEITVDQLTLKNRATSRVHQHLAGEWKVVRSGQVVFTDSINFHTPYRFKGKLLMAHGRLPALVLNFSTSLTTAVDQLFLALDLQPPVLTAVSPKSDRDLRDF